MERIDYARTAQTAREYGWQSSHTLVGEARQYALSGGDGRGFFMYDEARFVAALLWAEAHGTMAGMPGALAR